MILMKGLLKTLGTQQQYGSVSVTDESKLEPPWITMPGYPMRSMAWRMGGGEDIGLKFRRRYRSLSESSKENFQHQYPEPDDWKGYYSHIN